MTISLDHFQQKTTDELIAIAQGSTDDWQQIAIDEARDILRQRNVSQEEQLRRFNELERISNEYIRQQKETRKNEDYSLSEKITIIIRWPREILWGWGLKREGYELKAKRRLQLIALGILGTFLILAWVSYQWEQGEDERIKEINNTDISDWEKGYYGVDSNGAILRPKE